MDEIIGGRSCQFWLIVFSLFLQLLIKSFKNDFTIIFWLRLFLNYTWLNLTIIILK